MLHDFRYPTPWEAWYYNIVRPCMISSINSRIWGLGLRCRIVSGLRVVLDQGPKALKFAVLPYRLETWYMQKLCINSISQFNLGQLYR